MLITVNPQPTLWDAILPDVCRTLSDELAAVDALLDDEAFFGPFVPHFHATLGRPSTPIETYLRLMFLKYRYRVGFETLCREVTDSISWRIFCRISLDGTVPDPTTLMKLTSRCGASAIDALNDALLTKAQENKVLKTNKLRADTTVIPADVRYPTDSGLLAKGVTKLGRLVSRAKAAGLANRTAFRDRSRSAAKRVRSIAANLGRRTNQAKDDVARINRELIDIANHTIKDVGRFVRNATRAARKGATNKQRALIDALTETKTTLHRICQQSQQRLDGNMPEGKDRVISLHDTDARPIVKGRLGKPVEFGYKGQVVDNVDGIIVDHTIEQGNPADAPQLAPAIRRIKERTGKPPRIVTADRGYGTKETEDDLTTLGVKTIAITRKGKPTKEQQKKYKQRSFQRHIKWRTGAEGRISCLKRNYGWNQSRAHDLEGTKTWCGYGVFTHNLTKIAELLAE